jgi:DNA-binding transcriptional LysR family regulator
MGPGNRPLDLDWIEDFLALAEGGNFSRAAQARAIAQPAFSRHIRALEEWVGTELVDRSAHPASLTPAGRVFQPAALELLDGLTAARSQARSASRQDAHSLHFAATHLLSLDFFPRWLATLEPALQPGPIQMASDSAEACEDLLLQRRVHFVLCHGHASAHGRLDEAQLPMRVLSTDWLLPLAAPDALGQPRHAFGSAANGRPALLAYSDGSALGRIVAAHLHALQHPDVEAALESREAAVFTAHHAVLLKTLAIEGRGIAWLPQSLAADAIQAGTLVAAAPDALRVPVEVRLYRQNTPMGAAPEALWALLMQAGDARELARIPPLVAQ